MKHLLISLFVVLSFLTQAQDESLDLYSASVYKFGSILNYSQVHEDGTIIRDLEKVNFRGAAITDVQIDGGYGIIRVPLAAIGNYLFNVKKKYNPMSFTFGTYFNFYSPIEIGNVGIRIGATGVIDVNWVDIPGEYISDKKELKYNYTTLAFEGILDLYIGDNIRLINNIQFGKLKTSSQGPTKKREYKSRIYFRPFGASWPQWFFVAPTYQTIENIEDGVTTQASFLYTQFGLAREF